MRINNKHKCNKILKANELKILIERNENLKIIKYHSDVKLTVIFFQTADKFGAERWVFYASILLTAIFYFALLLVGNIEADTTSILQVFV